MSKLTVKIDDRVVERVEVIKTNLGINKETLYKMSILHGITMINNGYVPIYRREVQSTLTQIEIELSKETYDELNELIKTLSDYVEINPEFSKEAVYEIKEKMRKEKITKGQLVERMIDAEIKLFEGAIKKREFNKVNSKIFDSLTLPSSYVEEVKDISDRLNLKQEVVYSYILLRGISDEIQLNNYDLLGTDAELLYQIELLGLDKVKSMTLLNYMIKSNRMTWRR